MTKVCRICEQEVFLEKLHTHSFMCKELYDLKDDTDTLNMKIILKNREAIQLKGRIAKTINQCKPDLDDDDIARIHDLSRSNRALKQVIAYVEKIQHENFISYDTAGIFPFSRNA